MNALAHKITRFFACEDGQTAVEYAVMLSMIVSITMETLNQLGAGVYDTFDTVAESMSDSTSGGSGSGGDGEDGIRS